MMKSYGLLSALFLSVSLLGCQKLTTQDRIKEAEDAIKAGDFTSAIISLKNGIQEEPNSKILRDLLGSTLYEAGELESAEKEFRRSDNFDMLILSMFHQGKYEDVLLEIGYKKEPLSSHAVVLEYLSGKKLDRKNDLISENTLESLPAKYRALVEAYESVDKDEGAMLYDLAESSEVDYSYLSEELILTKTNILRAQGNYDRALETLKPLAGRWQSNAKVSLAFVDLLLRTGNFDLADKTLAPWLAQNENNPWANLSKASVEVSRENFKQAFFSVQKAIQYGIDTPSTNAFAGAIAVKTDNTELAYKYLTRANELRPGDIPVMQQLAEVQLNLGYLKDAELLLEVISQRKDSDIAFIISATEFLESRGYSEKTESIFKSLLKLAPDDRDVLKSLAQHEMTAGIDAIPTLKKLLVKDNSSIGSYMMLLQAHLSSDNLEAANNVALKVSKSNSTAALLMRALISLHEEDIEKAIQYADEVLMQSEHIGALRLASIASLRDERFDSAIEYISRLQKQMPENRAIARDLVLVTAQMADLEAIEDELKKSLGQKSIPVILAEELGQYLFENKRVELASQVLSKFDKLTEVGKTLFVNVLLAKEEFSQAKTYTSEWLNKSNGGEQALLVKLSVHEFLQEYGTVIKIINERKSDFRTDPRLGMMLFNAYIKIGRPEKTEIAIEMMEKSRVPAATLFHYRGQRALALGQMETAKEQLKKAFSENGSFGYAIFLAKVYASTNESEKGARILLDVLASDESLSRKKYHSIAEYLAKFGFHEDAIEVYRKIISKAPDDHAALNNLANSQLKNGALTEAYDNILLALAKFRSTDYLDTLGQIELKRGNKVAAERAFKEAGLDASNTTK